MNEELVIECSNFINALTHYFDGYKSKEDLFQAGWIGVTIAYKKYDPNREVKFSTYAYPYILGEMRKLIRQDKGIKISKNISRLYLKIEKANILLAQKLMRYPTTLELASFLEISENMIIECLKTCNIIQSIDEPIISDGKEITLHDTVSDKNIDIDSLITLRDTLSNLSSEDRKLIEGRYLYDFTQSEMAEELGISQVQVSRKEKKIKEKIRCAT